MWSTEMCYRGSRAGYTVALATLLLLWQPWSVNGIEFDMVFQTKCVYEEIVFESSALMTFHAFQISNPEVKVPLNIRVHDQEGTERFAKMDQESDKFNLPSLEEGRYKICFTAKNYHTAQNTRIKFKWVEGVDATDWSDVASREKLDSVHTELRRLEQVAHVMHYELQHIRRKEEQMRDVNEKTNSLVAFLSIGALLVCVGLSAFQVWSLRKFFKSKKVL